VGGVLDDVETVFVAQPGQPVHVDRVGRPDAPA
jgi:hypothetical protein